MFRLFLSAALMATAALAVKKAVPSATADTSAIVSGHVSGVVSLMKNIKLI